MKIGILVIATGKYIDFVDQFWTSAKKYLLAGSKYKVQLFVFTDSKKTLKDPIYFYQKHHQFPYPTLMRYHIFLKHKKELAKMDYLYYCDVDMKFVAPVGSEILGDLVATLHPGFYNQKRRMFTYETRKESTAYIPSNLGRHYFCGGFNGGTSKSYLKMAKTISGNIDRDLKKKIVAIWHDESHLNRFLIDQPPTKILNPSYCYPEELKIPFPKKLVALKKDHVVMRYSRLERTRQQIWFVLLECLGPSYRFLKKQFFI